MARRKRKTASDSRSRRVAPIARVAAALPPEPVHYDRITLGLCAIVVAAAGVLYAATAARDIVVGDTPEFIAAAITLGVPHGPGYPLFTLLGHLFSLLPIGPLPFRVNLLAAACSASTVGVVYLTAFRLTRKRLASAAAALMLALSPLFWRWSLVAEAFPLNNLLASLFIFLLVLWQERPEQTKFLVGAALVSGLALTNHHTFVLFGPAVIFLLWQKRNILLARPYLFAVCIATLLIGLVPYLYVPWAAARNPVLNWQGVGSWGDFFALVLRQHCGAGQLICNGPYQGGSPVDRLLAFGASFGALAGLLILLGLVQAYRERRQYFWFVLLAFIFAGPIFAAYANIDLSLGPTLFVLERFFLLSHVIVAPLIAFGLLFITRHLAESFRTLRAQAGIIVTGAVLLIALIGAVRNYKELDQSKNSIARRIAEDVLSTPQPGTLLLVAGDEVALPLLYLQAVEARRPEVLLVVMPMLSGEWYVRQLRQRYPDLVIPFTHYDGKSGTIKALADANKSRPIAVVGQLPDESTEGSYWFYRYGLVDLLQPINRDMTLPRMIRDNEELLSRYRLPSPAEIKPKSFEQNIVIHYAASAFAVGLQCENARQLIEARKWFERALTIYPEFSQAQQALTRIEKAIK